MTLENSDIQAVPQQPEASSQADAQPIDWIEILSVLWNSRKLIAYVTGVATVLSIIISLLLPEYFKSTATLLPETEKSKLAALGAISDIAAPAGVNIGGKASLPKFHTTNRKENSHVRG